MILFKKSSLIIIFLTVALFLQGYSFEYKVEELDSARNAANRNNTAIMYMEMGHYQAAETEFKIAISLVPNSPSSAAYYNNLGLLYLKIKNYIGAEDCFTNAININPVFLEYYKNLVATYANQNILNEKLNSYLSLIEKDSQNSLAYLYAGLIYIELGDNTLATNYLTQYVNFEKKG